jgi:hypothetical protein
MFVCRECKNLFEEPKTYFETHGLETPPYEKFTCCPFCGGTYVKTMPCDYCGEYIEGKYVEMPDKKVCCDYCYLEFDIVEDF